MTKNINLSDIYSKIDECGSKTAHLIHLNGLELDLPIYCDNRSCSNPKCKEHRQYQFLKNHADQISITQKSMNKPKAWVFTLPRQSYPINRNYIRSKFLKLKHILDKQSLTNYSIHLEIKLNDSDYYPHFHATLGGVKDLRFTRKLWGFQIKYQSAIKLKALTDYITKYASKTPYFLTDYHRELYLLATYKLQMHKFSAKHNPLLFQRTQQWYMYDFLVNEIINAYSNDLYYHPFLENKPPPQHKIKTDPLLDRLKNTCIEQSKCNYQVDLNA